MFTVYDIWNFIDSNKSNFNKQVKSKDKSVKNC